MGMFDTIVFQKPIVCRCSKKLEATQTKQFENTLSVYRVGDIVKGSSAFAVLEENAYCEDCNDKKEIYIAISYERYLGVFESYRDAKQKMEDCSSVGILKYHPPLYDRYENTQSIDRSFMVELVNYFEKNESNKELDFMIFGKYIKEAKTPLEAINNYLQKDKIKDAIAQAYYEKCEFDIAYEIKGDSAIIHNPDIESILSTDYLFKLVHTIHYDSDTEESILQTNGTLNEDTILDKVQEWLDMRGLRLTVVLAVDKAMI